MQISEMGIDLLKQRESCRLTPYQDSVGVWTDGWGNTIDVVPNGPPITQEKADADFARNLEAFCNAVTDSIKVPIEQFQFDALCSFAYNVGIGAEAHSTLARRINEQDPDAWQEFDRWHIPPEITSRRNGEREQFRGNAFEARIA